MPFTFEKTPLKDVQIITPKVFWDSRWSFMEIYHIEEFTKNGIKNVFIQDNESVSAKWTLRWLHFQKEYSQAKLVRVVSWSVYDVAVDLRNDSETFGQWYWIVLSAENNKQLFIPKWFAHGFLALEDNTKFAYKCDDIYAPHFDSGIIRDSEHIERVSKDLINILGEYNITYNQLIVSDKDWKLKEFDPNKNYFSW
jgi:dTDP-4-dehydrorhamnose 3,5-epimerase